MKNPVVNPMYVRAQCLLVSVIVRKKSQAIKGTKDCHICFENFRVEALQSFHQEHSLHLACRDCIKHYLDSLAKAVVTLHVLTVDYP